MEDGRMEDGVPSDIARTSEAPATTIKVPELENTGERFLPGPISSAEVAYDHFTRYRLAERYVEGKDTIDMGCGAGDGTHHLAGIARTVVGVDLSEDAVAYASTHHRAPNLRYDAGNVTDLPYEDESFEAAVSFKVLEHLEDPEELVLQAKRLLKSDGVFVVSTPNKQTYSIDRHRANPHHVSEMYPLEFRELLERTFEYVQMYWQGALAGSVITPDPKELPEDGRVTLESAQFSLPDPAFGCGSPATLHMVAVCTNGESPEPLDGPYLILDRDRQIYEEYEDLLYYQQMYRDHLMNPQEVHQMNKLLQEANNQVELARREMSDLQSTRGWKIASSIHIFRTKVLSILGRGG